MEKLPKIQTLLNYLDQPGRSGKIKKRKERGYKLFREIQMYGINHMSDL